MNGAMTTQALGDGRYVVALTGELDLHTAPRVKRELEAALDHGARTLVIDLSGATFVDSTTLGLLIGAHRRLRERGGEIAVVSDDRNVVKVFAITGLDRVFPILASLEEAFRRLE